MVNVGRRVLVMPTNMPVLWSQCGLVAFVLPWSQNWLSFVRCVMVTELALVLFSFVVTGRVDSRSFVVAVTWKVGSRMLPHKQVAKP